MSGETPQEAARRLAANAMKDGFKPEALHEYRDANGTLLYWRIRMKHADARKWIRPMHLNGRGYEIAEPDWPPSGKSLYSLPDLLARPAETIWFVEGEWNADHLARLGVLALLVVDQRVPSMQTSLRSHEGRFLSGRTMTKPA